MHINPHQILSDFDNSELIHLASELISIESHRDVPKRELFCAQKIGEVFRSWGFQPELVEVLNGRPNVYCRLRGSGGGKTLMLNGHLDTVPGYNMQFSPFIPFIENGCLFGRGSVDMKGGLACMMMTLKLLRDLNVQLRGDLIFSGVIGEEERSEGTEYIVRNGPYTDYCVIGEPTNMRIMAGHRGLEWLEFEFTGRAAHGGASHRGANAISMAAQFIHRIENDLIPKLSLRTNPLTGPAVINLGVIQGGTQPSTVADRCILQIDRRWTPEEKLPQVLSEFQQVIDDLVDNQPGFTCTMKRMENNMATMDHLPMLIALDNPLVKGVQSALSRTDLPIEFTNIGGWTDASLLSNYAKIPTLVFGPGDVALAHSQLEFVPIEQLTQSVLIYALLAEDICNQQA